MNLVAERDKGEEWMNGRELSVGVMYHDTLSRHRACEESVCWMKRARLGKREGSGMDSRISEHWSLNYSRK